MVRFCANCGTEVDEGAVFCPTCGQPIDQATESAIPPAPEWPEAPRAREPARVADEPVHPADEVAADARDEWIEEPTRVEERPTAASERWSDAPPPGPSPTRSAPAMPRPDGPSAAPDRGIDLPITWPVTLSAWLIGIGVLVAVVGLVIGMFRVINAIDLLLLLVLVAIAATVFFSTIVPAYRHLRLATLAAVLVGLGIAIDRLGFGLAGIGELFLFLGTAAAAIGALMLELGYDQPLGGGRG